jgi:hypothetical protein
VVLRCMPMLHDATPTPDLRFRCECSASQGAPSTRQAKKIPWSAARIEEVVIRPHNSVEDLFLPNPSPKNGRDRTRCDSKIPHPPRQPARCAAGKARAGSGQLAGQNSIKSARTDVSTTISRALLVLAAIVVEKLFEGSTGHSTCLEV